MPVQAQLHDGRILEFPDGTDPSVVQTTVKKVLGVSQEPAPAPAAPTPAPTPSLGPVQTDGQESLQAPQGPMNDEAGATVTPLRPPGAPVPFSQTQQRVNAQQSASQSGATPTLDRMAQEDQSKTFGPPPVDKLVTTKQRAQYEEANPTNLEASQTTERLARPSEYNKYKFQQEQAAKEQAALEEKAVNENGWDVARKAVADSVLSMGSGLSGMLVREANNPPKLVSADPYTSVRGGMSQLAQMILPKNEKTGKYEDFDWAKNIDAGMEDTRSAISQIGVDRAFQHGPGMLVKWGLSQLPSMAPAALGMAATTLNPALGLPIIATFVGADAGNAYKEYLKKGYTPEEAYSLSMIRGGTSAASMLAPGVISKWLAPEAQAIIEGASAADRLSAGKMFARMMMAHLATEVPAQSAGFAGVSTAGHMLENLAAGKPMTEGALDNYVSGLLVGGAFAAMHVPSIARNAREAAIEGRLDKAIADNPALTLSEKLPALKDALREAYNTDPNFAMTKMEQYKIEKEKYLEAEKQAAAQKRGPTVILPQQPTAKEETVEPKAEPQTEAPKAEAPKEEPAKAEEVPVPTEESLYDKLKAAGVLTEEEAKANAPERPEVRALRDKLNKNLADRGETTELKAGDLVESKPDAEWSAVSEALAKVTGRTPIYVEGKTPEVHGKLRELGAAFVDPDNPSVTYFIKDQNRASASPMFESGHEWFHTLPPEVKSRFIEAIRPFMQATDKAMEMHGRQNDKRLSPEARELYRKKMSETVKGGTHTKLEEEIASDFVGRGFADKKVWQRVQEMNPGLFKELALHALDFLEKVGDALGPLLPKGSNYVKHNEQTREMLAQLLHEQGVDVAKAKQLVETAKAPEEAAKKTVKKKGAGAEEIAKKAKESKAKVAEKKAEEPAKEPDEKAKARADVKARQKVYDKLIARMTDAELNDSPKSTAKKIAGDALKAGFITDAEHAEILRIAKDKDMTGIDVLDELNASMGPREPIKGDLSASPERRMGMFGGMTAGKGGSGKSPYAEMLEKEKGKPPAWSKPYPSMDNYPATEKAPVAEVPALLGKLSPQPSEKFKLVSKLSATHERMLAGALKDLLNDGLPKSWLNDIKAFGGHSTMDSTGHGLFSHDTRQVSINADKLSVMEATGHGYEQLRSWVAHELAHGQDITEKNTSKVAESPAFAGKTQRVGDAARRNGMGAWLFLPEGDIISELHDAWGMGDGPLGKELNYPFSLSDPREEFHQSEAFAQLAAVYMTAPDVVRTAAPKAYAFMQEVVKNGLDSALQGVHGASGEVSGQVPSRPAVVLRNDINAGRGSPANAEGIAGRTSGRGVGPATGERGRDLNERTGTGGLRAGAEGVSGQVSGDGSSERGTVLRRTGTTDESSGAGEQASDLLSSPKRGDAKPEDFAPDKVGDLLKKKRWAILTAENPEGKTLSARENARRNRLLEQDLKDEGYSYEKVIGRYNDPNIDEHSFIVYGIDPEKAVTLGEKHNQESVLTRVGLEYADGRITPAAGVTVHEAAPSQYYTRVPRTGAVFTVDLDFDKTTGPTKVTKELLPHLTPEEVGIVNESRTRVGKLLSIMRSLPPVAEFVHAALAGRAARGWYKRSRAAIIENYGSDAPRFISLMAALSPQTSVEGNFYNTVKVFHAWERAGRPTDPKKIKKILRDNLVKDESLGDEAVNAMEAWTQNGIRVLSSSRPDTVPLSGPKVSSFRANLLGDLMEVTNDRHNAAFGALLGTMFSGRSTTLRPLLFKSPGYMAFSARIREAASELTKMTGDKWEPAEVQETLWSFWKALTGLASAKGETRTPQQLLADGALTHEMVRLVPDLGSYFHEERYQSISGRAGETGSRNVARTTETGPVFTSEAGKTTIPAAIQSIAERARELVAARRARGISSGEGEGEAATGDRILGKSQEPGDATEPQPLSASPEREPVAIRGHRGESRSEALKEYQGFTPPERQGWWYHGTARDFDKFNPKQVNSVFVTRSPNFAEEFAGMSHSWMMDHWNEFVSDHTYKELTRRAEKLSEATDGKIEAYTFLRKMMSDALPSGPHIIPLYVRAENTFDPQNHQHVVAVAKEAGMPHQWVENVKFRASEGGGWTLLERHPEVMNAIKKLGFDSFYVFEGGEKNLGLFDNKQVKSVAARSFRRDIADLLASPARPKGGPITDEMGEWTPWKNFVRKYQNNLNRLDELQAAIVKAGGTLNDANNVVYAFERMPAIADRRSELFMENTLRPIIDDAARQNVNLKDAVELLKAEHTLTRNKYFRDKYGIDNAAGMDDAEAQNRIDAFRQSTDYQAIRGVADRLQAITTETAKILRDAGLIRQDEYQKWMEAYPDYIPMRGPDTELEDRDVSGYGKQLYTNAKGKVLDQRATVVERAKGRVTEPNTTEILGNIVNDHITAIIRAEQAKVGKHLLQLVLDNPDSTLWEVAPAEYHSVLRRVRQPDGSMKEVIEQVRAPDRDPANTIVVPVRGKEVVIKIKDPALAAQLVGSNREHVDQMIHTMGSVNRVLSKLWTQWNPVFAATNFIRDLQTAGIHVGSEYGLHRAASVYGHVPGAMGAYVKYERGKPMDPQWQRYIDEYLNNGGRTGYIDRQRLAERIDGINRMYRDAQDGLTKHPMDMARKVGDVVMLGNQAVENATRLAVYRAAREAGHSIADAISQAKNVTVNFQRRGDLGPLMNALYLFYNPAVQQVARMADAAKKAPKAMAALAGGMITTGFLAAAMGASDYNVDPEDGTPYWYKPQFEQAKQRNLVLIIPGTGGKAITIPMPYGYNALFTMGYALYDMMAGYKGIGQISAEQAASTMNGFMPVAQNMMDTGLTSLFPTVTQPFVNLAAGKDSFGGTLYPGNENQPDSERYTGQTRGTLLQKMTTGLNELTGGDSHIPGYISVSPETLNFMIKFVTGGVGTAAMDLFNLGSQAAFMGPGEADWSRLPFVKQLYEQHQPERDTRLFYDRFKELQQVKASLDEANRTGDSDRAEALREKYGTQLLIVVGNQLARFQAKMTELKKQQIAIQTDDDLAFGDKALQLKELDRKRAEVYAEFNQMFNEATAEDFGQSRLRVGVPRGL